jgi:hypothetical protein
MTKLLITYVPLRLKAAKVCTDRALEGEHIVLSIGNAKMAEELATKLEAIGAIVLLESRL